MISTKPKPEEVNKIDRGGWIPDRLIILDTDAGKLVEAPGFRCPACGHVQEVESDVCNTCGYIINRYIVKH